MSLGKGARMAEKKMWGSLSCCTFLKLLEIYDLLQETKNEPPWYRTQNSVKRFRACGDANTDFSKPEEPGQ